VDDEVVLGVDDEVLPDVGDGLLVDVAAIATPTPPASRPTVIAPPMMTRRNIAGLSGGMWASFSSDRSLRDPRQLRASRAKFLTGSPRPLKPFSGGTSAAAVTDRAVRSPYRRLRSN